MLTTKQAIAANGYKGNDKHKEWQKERGKEYQKHQQEMERGNRKHYKGMSHRSYDKRSDYPSIVGTENVPMTIAVITDITILKGIDTTITDIGGLGINGIDTEKNILTYINMEDITAKMHI
jgi:hypothetical protein